jgi:hypothetical protein
VTHQPEAVGRPHDRRWTAYATHGLWRIPGWANSLTLYLFSEVDRIQRELGIEGHPGEIGVYHGRTLVALGLLARRGETVVGIDGFGFAPPGPGSYGPVSTHIARQLRGTDAQVKLVKADSRTLTTDDLLAASGGPYRLFQVDGGHDAQTVAHDLAITAPALHPGGVLVADDVFNEMYPGVNEATRAFISTEAPDGFVPFLAGGGRVFLARREYAARYRDGMDYDGYWAKDDIFAGAPVMCVGYHAGRGSRRPKRPLWLQASRVARQQLRTVRRRLAGRPR